MKLTLTTALILFSSLSVISQTSNPITTAVPFLRFAPDARSSGMGEIGIATTADAHAMHWNTSKSVFSDSKLAVGYTYSPLYRPLLKKNHFHELTGFYKLNSRHAIGASVNYKDCSEMFLITATGSQIDTVSMNEFEFALGYAYRLNERNSIGVNAKYIYSDLISDLMFGTLETKPGNSIAVDLSYSHQRNNLKFLEKTWHWSFGATISNLGNKMTYTSEVVRDFLPANLGLGSVIKMELKTNNSVSFGLDANKLLVPTSPIYGTDGQIISGYDNNVSALVGVIQSFYDAPGTLVTQPNGTVEVEKGSRFKEEMNEIRLGFGIEYEYKDLLSLRGGYIHQARSKGVGSALTLGAGVKWRYFQLNASYLAAMSRVNPLANNFVVSVIFQLKQ
jgi:hypothetical protein